MMSIDTMQLQTTETEKWLLTEYYCKALAGEIDDSDEIRNFQIGMWPFLQDYFSPLNPLYSPFFSKFAAGGFKPPTEKHRPVWMLRDGAVPLAWFFSRNSSEKFSGQLLVHADLAQLIPKVWRTHAKLYRTKSLVTEKPESLLLAGAMNRRFTSLDELERQLDRIEERLGKRRMASIKVTLYCPVRGEGEDFPAAYMQKLCSRFRNISVVDWFHMENVRSFRGSAYVELNSGWILKDSYVQHLALSRGASLLFEDGAKGTSFQQISRYHGVEISKPGAGKCILDQPARELEDYFTMSEKFPQLGHSTFAPPWPISFDKRCRALLQGKLK